MHILFLANIDTGLYKFRKELIQELCQENRVTLALPDGEFIGGLKDLGCEYVPCEFNRRGMNPLADLKLLVKYIRLIHTLRPDVVLTYTIKPNVYGGMACRCTKTPYIANITGLGTSIENGGLLSVISTKLYRSGLKKATCVFFQNSENKKFFEKAKVVRTRSRLIPGSGVNLLDFKQEPFPSEENTTRFLFVGRIMKDKGIIELLKAIAALKDKRKDVFLDIVGGFDEDFVDELQKYEDVGLVKVHGRQADVHPFYKNTHCVVLPSYHEGMANVLLEGAATGRPIIATTIPGCREVFEEGITGFGCEPQNVPSLLSAMERFLTLSHNERKEMGVKGRKKVEREFDRKRVIDAYLEEIQAIGERGNNDGTV